ncbi:solute carrier family 25 member 45 [Orussus abietinus]|uniref:solute carrier family 25 member 45 n=1 Tax=Orussus abietinus TaxID=222816 RepID=UPI0006261B31|nr:solute carrier family 25 member 45 [Orussus abietinus]
MAGLLVGHPLDTVKIYQQIVLRNDNFSSMAVAIGVFKKDGISGLYRGMLFPLLTSGLMNSIFFGVYASSLRFLQKLRGNGDVQIFPTSKGYHWDTLTAGCLGGLVQVFASCPSEVVKIRMQVGKGWTGNQELLRSSWQVAAQVRNEVLYYFPVSTKRFGVVLRTGAISWIPVVPLDNIKSRLQADDFKNPSYKGMMDCYWKMCRAGGMTCLFRGSSVIIVRSFPVNAATFYGYETITWGLDHLFALPL